MTEPQDSQPSEPQDPQAFEPRESRSSGAQEQRPAFEPPDPFMSGPVSPDPPPHGPGSPYGPGSSQGPGSPYGPGSPGQPGSPYAGSPVPYGYGPPREGFAAIDETTWALLAYIGQFAFGFVAPLIVFLAYKDRSPRLRFHGAQALNLAVTGFLLTIAAIVVSIATLGIGAIVAIPALLVYGVAHVAYLIIAAVRANKGEPYVIPKWLCWPIVR